MQRIAVVHDHLYRLIIRCGVEVAGDHCRCFTRNGGYLFQQQMGAFSPCYGTPVIKVCIEMDEYLFCFFITELSPAYDTGDGCIPSLAARYIRCGGQPEGLTLQQL